MMTRVAQDHGHFAPLNVSGILGSSLPSSPSAERCLDGIGKSSGFGSLVDKSKDR